MKEILPRPQRNKNLYLLLVFVCFTLSSLELHSIEPPGELVALGDLPGGQFQTTVTSVSADGSVIVGWSYSANGREAFRWTEAEGMVGLGDLPGGQFDSWATGVNADGSVVVGRSSGADGYEAFRWTVAEGMVGLGDLPGGIFDSSAEGVNADGTVIVGLSEIDGGAEAFLWTQQNGMSGLGHLGAGMSQAVDVNGSGTVVAGASDNAQYNFEAFRWTQAEGMLGLGDLPGGVFQSWANAISSNGEVIVGASEATGGREPFRWTQTGGMTSLGKLSQSSSYGQANGVNTDGQVVVGQSGSNAFVWSQEGGMRALKDWLIAKGVKVQADVHLYDAIDISDNGKVIIGAGGNPNSSGAFMVRMCEQYDVTTDSDNDGVLNEDDNCPLIANANQLDTDSDGVGNSCDDFPNDASKSLAAISFFPLAPGNQSQFNSPDGIVTSTVSSGVTYVNGIATRAVSSSDGDVVYMTNDGNGIRRHRSSGPGWVETYSSPIVYVRASVNVGSYITGSGTANIQSVDLGNFSIPYSFVTEVKGSAKVEVPAGTFDAYELTETLTIDGKISGGPYSGTYIYGIVNQTLWVSKGIGIVKTYTNDDGVEETSELISTNLDNDGDTIANVFDNCPSISNKYQFDHDEDGLGDVCDTDDDNDALIDIKEDVNNNCAVDAGETNPLDSDTDKDGVIDGMDAFPLDGSESLDTDSDGIGDNADNCPLTSNPTQNNNDQDDKGDACDPDDDNDGVSDVDELAIGRNPFVNESAVVSVILSMMDDEPDVDNDGIPDAKDNCPDIANPDQLDTDQDKAGNACDSDDDNDTLPDIDEDKDKDGILDPGETDPLNADTDSDGLRDNVEIMAGTDPRNPDTDNDGISDGDEVLAGRNPSVNEGAIITILQQIMDE